MISAEFRGIRAVPRRAMKLKLGFPIMVQWAANKAVVKIKDMAMDSLNASVKGTTFSHGWPVIHIKDAWEGHKPGDGVWEGDDYKVVLRNVSEHAAAVEFGVHHLIFPKPGHTMLYLGNHTYAPYVRGQQGYHYLQQAISRHDEIFGAFKSEILQRWKEVLI